MRLRWMQGGAKGTFFAGLEPLVSGWERNKLELELSASGITRHLWVIS